MSDNETTAVWDGDILMVRWYGSKTADEAGYWLPNSNRFCYDGYDDTYRFAVEGNIKPDAATMLSAMVAHQNGY